MSRNKMKDLVRKPNEQKNIQSKNWQEIYDETYQRAENRNDPRIDDLNHYKDNPEKALRHLSIISWSDLEREFPLKEG